MIIYYWCPFLTHVATVDAVKNSIKSIKKFRKDKDKIIIINSCGEWDFNLNDKNDFDIINLQKKNYHKNLPKTGFFKSRISFLIIFFTSLLKLLNLIKKNKPDFLIIHLLTILPIILSPILSKYTKIILRISGYPKLNIFRKKSWRFFSKYLYKITTPTELTLKLLSKNQIFPQEKMFVLRDPIIQCSEIIKKAKSKKNILNDSYYISVGRLTEQKNYEFLINTFAKNLDKFKVKKLIIIGDGEKSNTLKKLVKNLKAEKNIFFFNFQSNIYKYIANAEALISVAHYEDPGFAILEAAFLRKNIITSLVPNGPLEMYMHNNDMCYFFKKNNSKDLINSIVKNENEKRSKYFKNLAALKFSKQFTLFNHYNHICKILS